MLCCDPTRLVIRQASRLFTSAGAGNTNPFGKPCLNPLCHMLAHSNGLKGKMEGYCFKKCQSCHQVKKVIADDEEVPHGKFCERLLAKTGAYKPK